MRRLLAACLGTCLTAGTAHAVELEDATNRQLVQELQRRLDLGSGGQDPAIATFLCDAYGVLRLSLVNAAGQQSDWQVSLGSRDRCRDQATPLQQRRGRIARLTLVAVCDPYGSMRKLALKPDGTVSELDTVPFGSIAACLEQAAPINNG